MTTEEVKALGYEVIAASPFEVGLVKGDKGVRTWFCQDFDWKLPPLSHPKILEAVERNEAYKTWWIHHESTERATDEKAHS